MANRVLSNFVVLEGLDGSGTTTQMELLSQRLETNGRQVFSTCEPSRGSVGTFIRRVLRQELNVEPCTLAHLFAADRNEHLFDPKEGMVTHLESGDIVVCDRYLYSSLAYQSVGCSFEFVRTLNSRFPLPGYLIMLDVSAEECQRRLSERPGVELFDGPSIQDIILANYERALQEFVRDGVHLIRVDGSESIERVSENIWSGLESLPIQRM